MRGTKAHRLPQLCFCRRLRFQRLLAPGMRAWWLVLPSGHTSKSMGNLTLNPKPCMRSSPNRSSPHESPIRMGGSLLQGCPAWGRGIKSTAHSMDSPPSLGKLRVHWNREVYSSRRVLCGSSFPSPKKRPPGSESPVWGAISCGTCLGSLHEGLLGSWVVEDEHHHLRCSLGQTLLQSASEASNFNFQVSLNPKP